MFSVAFAVFSRFVALEIEDRPRHAGITRASLHFSPE